MKPIHRVIFVGDLHVKEWAVFPSDKFGVNGFLKIIGRCFDGVAALAKQEKFTEEDAIIFLGDLADEPYRKGVIGVPAMACVCRQLEALSQQTPAQLHVIAGNHDRVVRSASGGRTVEDWFAALPPCVKIASTGSVALPCAGGITLYLVSYASKDEIEKTLLNLPRDSIVAGHFVTSGTTMDNGRPYSHDEAIDPAIAKRFKLIVCGHAHTPQVIQLDKTTVVMPGIPAPYSWAAKHSGKVVLLDTATLVRTDVDLGLPMFLGPVKLEQLREESSALQQGSFVRLLVGITDTQTLKLARAEFPTLRISPVIDTDALVYHAVTDCPRIEALATCTDGANVVGSLVASYVDYQKDKSAQGLSIETLLEIGKGLLGGDGGA